MTTICHVSVNRFNKKKRHHVFILVFLALNCYVIWDHCLRYIYLYVCVYICICMYIYILYVCMYTGLSQKIRIL